MLWILTSVPYDLHLTSPTLFYWLTLSWIALSGFRMVQSASFLTHYKNNKQLWSRQLYVGALLCAILWMISLLSVLHIYGIHSDIGFIFLLVTLGIAIGGTNNLMPLKPLALAYLLILILPIVVYIFIYSEQLAMSIILLVYLVNVLIVAKNQNAEYVRAINNEISLQKHKEKLEKLNQTDDLTGIANRHFFEKIYQSGFYIAQRENIPFTLLIIDLDDFKAINDNFGHLAGDQCLINVAKILMNVTLRKSDLPARFGGEEFVMILPATDLNGATHIAEKIRSTIEQTPIHYQDKMIQITSSIGMAVLKSSNYMTPDEFFEYADKALYQAKETGKNKVCISENKGLETH